MHQSPLLVRTGMILPCCHKFLMADVITAVPSRPVFSHISFNIPTTFGGNRMLTETRRFDGDIGLRPAPARFPPRLDFAIQKSIEAD